MKIKLRNSELLIRNTNYIIYDEFYVLNSRNLDANFKVIYLMIILVTGV